MSEGLMVLSLYGCGDGMGRHALGCLIWLFGWLAGWLAGLLEGLEASEEAMTLHRLAVIEGVASPNDAEAIGVQLGKQLRALAQQHGWLDE